MTLVECKVILRLERCIVDTAGGPDVYLHELSESGERFVAHGRLTRAEYEQALEDQRLLERDQLEHDMARAAWEGRHDD